MTCTTESCDPWGTLVGRNVIGRNTPGENIRYPSGNVRNPSVPLTDAQRAQRHYQRYGTTNLPPRGTGLGINTAGSLDATNFFQGLVVGCISVLAMTATGRGIAAAAGRRVQRRIEYGGTPRKA